MKRVSVLFVLLALLFVGVHSATKEQWYSRTIYQLLTDRFAQDTFSTNGCDNLSDYCGGTWQGITNNLDYITGMGFDAIWISPVVLNTPEGYHGYWAQDITQVNPNFGTQQDLINMVNAAHSKGVWVMLDLVINHVGSNAPLSSIVPFNDPSYYHNCSNCPSGCQIQDYTCFTEQLEDCRLAGLPDLDQSNEFVNQTFLKWIETMISTYGFDGLRVDTVPEVNPAFWPAFMKASNDIYFVGEVFSDMQCSQQYSQMISSVLGYPMVFNIRDVFGNGNSFSELNQTLDQVFGGFADPDAVGTFIDNHDNPRWLNLYPNVVNYKAALTFLLMSRGVPIVYYGTEQEFNGGNDPANREVLWPSSYSTSAELYVYLQTVINYRKTAQIWQYTQQIQRYLDDQFLAFTRGLTFVALTNQGNDLVRTITYHPYQNGQKLCNLFYPTQDCITVTNGQFQVYLNNGENKIYYPVD
eukprot:TRINITY_DN4238_c0_g1_i1.p1 TRINITY_DN4238_c0_g1~~TRINITY_DN4238_c0_g1_i1.p1  ORF type:complete len:467 (+),score=100.77 TRINITY_DN4238_c0_g1_i1:205-1605(+)